MKQPANAAHPKAKNPWLDAWHSLKKNKMALVGGCVLLFFILVAAIGLIQLNATRKKEVQQ